MRQKVARGEKRRCGAERQATTERIQRLLEEIERRLENRGSKASAADYARLIDLEQELEKNAGATEITVTWVEATKAEDFEE